MCCYLVAIKEGTLLSDFPLYFSKWAVLKGPFFPPVSAIPYRQIAFQTVQAFMLVDMSVLLLQKL